METSSPGGPTPRSKVRSPHRIGQDQMRNPSVAWGQRWNLTPDVWDRPPLEGGIRRLPDKVGLAHGQGTLHSQNSPLGSSGPVYAPNDAAPARYRPIPSHRPAPDGEPAPGPARCGVCANLPKLPSLDRVDLDPLMRLPRLNAFPADVDARTGSGGIGSRDACRKDERSQAERSMSATSSRGSSLATRSAPASRKRSASAGSFVCGAMTCSPAAWSWPIAMGVIGRPQGWA